MYESFAQQLGSPSSTHKTALCYKLPAGISVTHSPIIFLAGSIRTGVWLPLLGGLSWQLAIDFFSLLFSEADAPALAHHCVGARVQAVTHS